MYESCISRIALLNDEHEGSLRSEKITIANMTLKYELNNIAQLWSVEISDIWKNALDGKARIVVES